MHNAMASDLSGGFFSVFRTKNGIHFQIVFIKRIQNRKHSCGEQIECTASTVYFGCSYTGMIEHRIRNAFNRNIQHLNLVMPVLVYHILIHIYSRRPIIQYSNESTKSKSHFLVV